MGYVVRAARVAYAWVLDAVYVYSVFCFVVVLWSRCTRVLVRVRLCEYGWGVRTARGTRARGGDVGAGGTMCSSPCRVRRAVPCWHGAVPGENTTHIC